MTVTELSEWRHRRGDYAVPEPSRTPLAAGGSGAHPPGMEVELALLKLRADGTDQRLERIEGKLDRLLDTVATKDELQQVRADVKRAENAAWNALGVGAALAVGIVALFVGVLAYLQDRQVAARPEVPIAAAPQPIIIQLPAPAPVGPATSPAPAAPG